MLITNKRKKEKKPEAKTKAKHEIDFYTVWHKFQKNLKVNIAEIITERFFKLKDHNNIPEYEEVVVSLLELVNKELNENIDRKHTA